jgi:hypothetical protein
LTLISLAIAIIGLLIVVPLVNVFWETCATDPRRMSTRVERR